MTAQTVCPSQLPYPTLQSSNDAYERDADRLLTIATSFECREVQA